jgi:site-specific recombinase XerD
MLLGVLAGSQSVFGTTCTRAVSRWKDETVSMVEPTCGIRQDAFLLTQSRQPFTKNSLIILFDRLNQRAGFTTAHICTSMLRDTYAIRFLQAGGDLSILQEQLGLADPGSVRRYQRFCDERQRAEAGEQAHFDGQVHPHGQPGEVRANIGRQEYDDE